MIGFSRLVMPRSVAPWLFAVSPGRIIFGPISGMGTRPARLEVSCVLMSPFSSTEQEKMCGSTAVLEVSAAMSPRPTQTGPPGREGWGWVSRAIILAFSLLYLFAELHFVVAVCHFITLKNQKLLAVDDDSLMKVNQAGSVVKREQITFDCFHILFLFYS